MTLFEESSQEFCLAIQEKRFSHDWMSLGLEIETIDGME
jgi:hypothetical protein